MSSPYLSNINSIQFYKVLFSHVTSLIKKRKVFVMNGEAFVPEGEIAFVFVPYFKRILISSFEVSICEVYKNNYYKSVNNYYHFLFYYYILGCT